MRYFSVIIFVAFIFAVSSAQVDTLQLVEIGSIQAPSEITELYVEDLDGDSLKEIIITTDYYVYIYNSQTYQVQWTSPPLNAPTDLLFEDIKNDGLIDLSVKDSTNIHLFDPHTPQTIWTSPPLDSTYKCYTIGDRNDDDWIDIVIVSKEWFTRGGDYNNLDTNWVSIFDGPSFTIQNEFLILLPNYAIIIIPYYWYGYHYEFIEKVSIYIITASAGPQTVIALFSNIYDLSEHTPGPDECLKTGDLIFINATTFEELLTSEIGLVEHRILSQSDTVFTLLTVSSRWFTFGLGWSKDIMLSLFSADSILYSNTFWQSSLWQLDDWEGSFISDVYTNNEELELCFGENDSLVLCSLEDPQVIWTSDRMSGLDSLLFAFRDSGIYVNPQVICSFGNPPVEYRFINGSNGSLSAILLNLGFELSQVADFDGDGSDEILSIQYNSIIVYDLDVVTGISDESRLPRRVFLNTNYPNPFNSSTTIEYGLPEAGRVRIDIYDLLGRKVETLVDEDMQAGQYQAVWDASGYSSGVYFYRIESGDFVDTKRMVYLK